MSLASILTDVKSRLAALLTFANEKTGAADTSIGDAIHTLADGYGGGALATGTFVGNGTQKITINLGIPDFDYLIIYNPDYWTNRKTVAYAINGVCFAKLAGKYLMFACMDNFNATGLQGGDGSDAPDQKNNGKPCLEISNGIITWNYANTGGTGKFRDGVTYNWIAF